MAEYRVCTSCERRESEMRSLRSEVERLGRERDLTTAELARCVRDRNEHEHRAESLATELSAAREALGAIAALPMAGGFDGEVVVALPASVHKLLTREIAASSTTLTTQPPKPRRRNMTKVPSWLSEETACLLGQSAQDDKQGRLAIAIKLIECEAGIECARIHARTTNQLPVDTDSVDDAAKGGEVRKDG